MLESGGCQEQLVGRVLVAPSRLQACGSGLWLVSVQLCATSVGIRMVSGFAAHHGAWPPAGTRRGSLHHA